MDRIKKIKLLPSIWQQPNYRGEEHKEADAGEGKRYPGEDRKKTKNLYLTFLLGFIIIIIIIITSHIIQDFFTPELTDNRLEPAQVHSQTANS